MIAFMLEVGYKYINHDKFPGSFLCNLSRNLKQWLGIPLEEWDSSPASILRRLLEQLLRGSSSKKDLQ